jgi:hypothetical protein
VDLTRFLGRRIATLGNLLVGTWSVSSLCLFVLSPLCLVSPSPFAVDSLSFFLSSALCLSLSGLYLLVTHAHIYSLLNLPLVKRLHQQQQYVQQMVQQQVSACSLSLSFPFLSFPLFSL